MDRNICRFVLIRLVFFWHARPHSSRVCTWSCLLSVRCVGVSHFDRDAQMHTDNIMILSSADTFGFICKMIQCKIFRLRVNCDRVCAAHLTPACTHRAHTITLTGSKFNWICVCFVFFFLALSNFICSPITYFNYQCAKKSLQWFSNRVKKARRQSMRGQMRPIQVNKQKANEWERLASWQYLLQ